MPQKARNVPEWLVLALIVAIAAGLRTYHLSHVIAWYDETYSLMHASATLLRLPGNSNCITFPETFQSLLDQYQFHSGPINQVFDCLLLMQPEHAPGFYLILHEWITVVKDVTLLRLLPISFGLLCIPAFYWFTYELFHSKGTSLLCALALALSPLQITTSQNLREQVDCTYCHHGRHSTCPDRSDFDTLVQAKYHPEECGMDNAPDRTMLSHQCPPV